MMKFKRRKKKPKNMKSLLSKELHCSRRNVYVGDKFLTPVTDKDFGRFLVEDRTDSREYRKNVFECNLFALNLVTNAKNWFLEEYEINAAVGMLWTKKTTHIVSHSFNFYVTPKLNIHFVEPQNDLKLFLENFGRAIFVYI